MGVVRDGGLRVVRVNGFAEGWKFMVQGIKESYEIDFQAAKLNS